jgi:hypothetical protein
MLDVQQVEFQEQKEYLEEKLMNMKQRIRDLCRGICEFKKGYQPRTNLVKVENGDLLADSQNTLKMKKLFLSAIKCT